MHPLGYTHARTKNKEVVLNSRGWEDTGGVGWVRQGVGEGQKWYKYSPHASNSKKAKN